ncbi:DUF4321 domain-containing protein [Desulforamulus ruminis]|uniref:DUF4321 domain-containing protein n=1 Tax=Desulforamulus ruminis TaxID=1564 RepID=UPI00059CFC2F|nr:DUF4321 domain-containing protein [Desulforamulus ruminis]
MSRPFRGGRGPGTLVILLLAGGLAGSALGHALTPYVPFLKNFTTFGLDNTNLSLFFLKVSFGLTMALGPLTGLGILLGFLAYRRL